MKKFVVLALALVAPLLAADESFGGVGITIVSNKTGVTVVDVIPGTPAEEAGIQKGDKIFAVDRQNLPSSDLEASKDILRGTPGKQLELTLVREGDTLSVTMSRTQMDIREVSAETLTSWYGEEKTDYSLAELQVVAEQSGSEDETLVSVLRYGRVVSDTANATPEDLKAIFVEKEKFSFSNEGNTEKTAVKGIAKLRGFSRSLVAFSTTKAGNVRIIVTDAKGVVYLDRVVSAKSGANYSYWDGTAVPSDRYSIVLEQNGTTSSYFTVLR